MKKSKIFVILIIIVIVFVCLGLFLFFKGILDDSKITNQRIGEIKNINVDMNDTINDYNNSRKTLSLLLDSTYTDNLNDKYDNIVLLLNKEETFVKSAKDIVLKLDNDCDGKFYSDAIANGICLSYKVNYEEMCNVFMNDIKNINDMIHIYNNGHTESLQEYVSNDFSDYIDYNQDGNFSGKEE